MDVFDSVNKTGFYLLKCSRSQCPEKQLPSTPQNQLVFGHWTVILVCSKLMRRRRQRGVWPWNLACYHVWL